MELTLTIKKGPFNMNFIEWELEDFYQQNLFLQEISSSGLLIISCFVFFFPKITQWMPCMSPFNV